MDRTTADGAAPPDYVIVVAIVLAIVLLHAGLLRVGARRGVWPTAAMWLASAVGTTSGLCALMIVTEVVPIGIGGSGDPQGAMGAGLALVLLNGGAALATGLVLATLTLILGRSRRIAIGAKP